MHVLVLGDRTGGLDEDARAQEAAFRPAARLNPAASTLGWRTWRLSPLPSTAPRLIHIDRLQEAFPNRQANGVRLILTQPAYVIQKWLDALDAADRIVATADRMSIERELPEIARRQGPFRQFTIVTASRVAVSAPNLDSPATDDERPEAALLAAAFALPATIDRLEACRTIRRAHGDSPLAALALASAAREANDAELARSSLDAALALAPDWDAALFEDAKFWLAAEAFEPARDRFRAAVDRMPSFTSAWSNLGATLGELGDVNGALDAFAHALTHDPDNVTLLSNVGVASREAADLDRSEAALERVVALAPAFVFGHYNLGHTRFLRGDYAGALRAYEEGQRLDPEKNRRQGCRLAVVRFALGDIEGASRDLWRHADAAPAEEREDLLLEIYEIADALVKVRPALSAHHSFLTRIAEELTP